MERRHDVVRSAERRRGHDHAVSHCIDDDLSYPCGRSLPCPCRRRARALLARGRPPPPRARPPLHRTPAGLPAAAPAACGPAPGASPPREGHELSVSVQMSFHDITLDLARGYVYDGYRLNLGSFVEPGPGGGEGFLSWGAAFAGDRAGNAAAVDVSLAATNAFRKVYGIAWYYHCDTVAATRTFIRPRLLNLGGAKPTGFTTTGDNGLFWFGSGDITLPPDEEGAHIIVSGEAKDGRGVRVDNGTITITAANADPSPFPLPVTEAELAVIRFPAITNGEATDTHSAYILIEEWLVL